MKSLTCFSLLLFGVVTFNSIFRPMTTRVFYCVFKKNCTLYSNEVLCLVFKWLVRLNTLIIIERRFKHTNRADVLLLYELDFVELIYKYSILVGKS